MFRFQLVLAGTLVPLWLLLVLLQTQLQPTQGQQEPAIWIPHYYDNPKNSLRQNVCDRYLNYVHSEDQELRFALEGLKLNTAVVAIFSSMYVFDYHEEGKMSLNADYPGLIPILLDELASRGRFTWRDTYAVYTKAGENRTSTDLLLWTTDFFDISANWWDETLERLKLGVAFPDGWYKGDYILVGVKQGDENERIDMWTFLEPFDAMVWVAILVTIILAGIMYQLLEDLGRPINEDQTKEESPLHRLLHNRGELKKSIFLSSILFTQHFEFEPTTTATRLFSASMALWALLISSAYTANLASFFVIQNRPQFQVETIDDAVRANLPLCVHGTTASAVYMENKYPKANLIRKSQEIDLYMAVNNGECTLAVTAFHSFEQYKSDMRTNPDCKLEQVGHTIHQVPATFAMKSDSGKLCTFDSEHGAICVCFSLSLPPHAHTCDYYPVSFFATLFILCLFKGTSLIHYVLNLHLVEMNADGFIEKAWAEQLARYQDKDCQSAHSDTNGEGDELGNNKRTLQEMGGTFVLHLFFTIVALIYAIGRRWIRKQKRKVKASKSIPTNDFPTNDDCFSDDNDKEDEGTMKTKDNKHVPAYAAALEVQIKDLRCRQALMEDQLSTIVRLLQKQQKDR